MTSYLAPTYGLAGWLDEAGHGYLGPDGLDEMEVRDGHSDPSDGVHIGATHGGRSDSDAAGFAPPPLDDGGRVYAASAPREWASQLTEDDVLGVLFEAGVPAEWHQPLLRIGWCESKWSPGAVGDAGNSLGWLQLNWETWMPYALGIGLISPADADAWADPVVNAKVGSGVVRYSLSRGQRPYQQWTCQP